MAVKLTDFQIETTNVLSIADHAVGPQKACKSCAGSGVCKTCRGNGHRPHDCNCNQCDNDEPCEACDQSGVCPCVPSSDLADIAQTYKIRFRLSKTWVGAESEAEARRKIAALRELSEEMLLRMFEVSVAA